MAASAAPLLASSGIALGRRAGRAQVTALVLSLRRRAEADAQEQLRRLRLQLELARRSEAQAQRQLEQARKRLQDLSAEHAQLGVAAASGDRLNPSVDSGPPPPAQLLASRAARLLQQRQLVRDRQRDLDTQAAHLQTLLRQQGELHQDLRRALALREAAELHESEELREQRRARAQRQRTLEEEARDRFLSAQRQTKTHPR
ncbi:MAG TPA: hypothetical protein PLW65_11890 [Pseudomonadota bacterium]|nr:hypothetical protein [Pseudomonadota bacterium]